MTQKNIIRYLPIFAGAVLFTRLFVQQVAGFEPWPLTPPVTPPVTPPITPPITITPTPTPVPKKNHPPRIYPQKRVLPSGIRGRFYQTKITAADVDNDWVTVTISNLPTGLIYSCSAKPGETTCQIRGVPRYTGIFQIKVKAQDNQGASTTAKFLLLISSTKLPPPIK